MATVQEINPGEKGHSGLAEPIQYGASDVSDDSEQQQKVNENALLRKLDIRLLPSVVVLYLLSFLDRSNVANARIEGLVDDLGIAKSMIHLVPTYQSLQMLISCRSR